MRWQETSGVADLEWKLQASKKALAEKEAELTGIKVLRQHAPLQPPPPPALLRI
jgi:hypothetical protein